MKNAIFTQPNESTVIVQYNGETETFIIPSGGGYVRRDSLRGPQVCGALKSTGNTLSAKPKNLLPLIKRHWHAWASFYYGW
jgi:hypothetical protein